MLLNSRHEYRNMYSIDKKVNFPLKFFYTKLLSDYTVYHNNITALNIITCLHYIYSIICFEYGFEKDYPENRWFVLSWSKSMCIKKFYNLGTLSMNTIWSMEYDLEYEIGIKKKFYNLGARIFGKVINILNRKQ